MLLQNDGILVQIDTFRLAQEDHLNDLCDGEYVRAHPVFSKYPDALQIIAYYNDVEIVNPRGTKVKKQNRFVYIVVSTSSVAMLSPRPLV